MRRLAPRWLVYTLGLLLVLAVVGLVSVHLYLKTDKARHLVASQLEAQLGGPVEVNRLNVSTFGSSTLHGLRVLDKQTGKSFLEADEVQADLSVMGILLGRRMPRRLELDGVRIDLAFSAAGDLLTHLPEFGGGGGGPTPEVRINKGSLNLAQEGRPPLRIEGIDLRMTADATDNLSGNVTDPTFGRLTITGHSGDALVLTLRGTTPRITAKMLKDLPFVPRDVWQYLEAEGTDVPLTLDFTFQKAAPQVRYRVGFGQARVRLFQPDRPALEVYPTKGVLKGSGGDFTLDGEINDPYWGDWTVGVRDLATEKETRIALKTASVPVDQKKLEALPYVPKHVWQEVRAAGQTSADVLVRLQTGKPGAKYRVDLGVRKATVHVTAIDLDVTDASGRVLVEDELVTLEKVIGKTADGHIATRGKLDFRPTPSRMAFDVDMKGVSLRKLPAKWDLPKQIEGKITGKANLVVTLREAGPVTTGSGEAEIDDAKVAGFKTSEPIKLNLHADGKRIRFLQGASTSSALPRVLPLLLSAIRAEEALAPLLSVASPEAAGRLAGQLLAGVEVASRRIADGTVDTLRFLAGLEKPLRAKETTYLDAHVKLEDVDLAELAKRVDVKIPVALAGRLSLDIQLGVPINNANSLRDYRLKGTAGSSRLVVAGLEMTDLKARVDYARGVLRLSEFAGKVPSAAGVGTFSTTARMGVVPRGDLTFEGTIDRIPAESLAKIVPAARGKAVGLVSGKVSAGVAVNSLGDPAVWRGTASLSIPTLTAFGVSLRDLSAGATLAAGKLTIDTVKGQVYKGSLLGSGRLDLTSAGAYQATFRLRGVDLAGPGAMLPAGFALEGSGDLSGTVQGTLEPRKLTGSGSIRTGKVRMDKFTVDDLTSDWTLTGETLQLSKITGSLYKGTATGSAEVRLATGAGKVKLHLEKLDAAVLSKSVEGVPLKLEGQVAADINVDIGSVAGKTSLNGQLGLKATKLRLQGIATDKVAARILWKGERLNYRLEGEALGGKFSVEGDYPPAPPGPAGAPQGRLRLQGLKLGRLATSGGWGETWRPLRGSVTLDLPFRFDGPKRVPVGQGRYEISNLGWGDTDLAETLQGVIRLGATGLSVRSENGTLARGELSVNLLYPLTGSGNGSFRIDLSGADSATLLVMLREGTDRVQGSVDIHLRGEIGAEWQGTGEVDISRGKVAGVVVSDWRVPLDFSFAPETGNAEVTVRDSAAQIGLGRATFSGNVHYADTLRVEGVLQLVDASVGALAGMTGDVSSYIRGRITGRAVFSGSDMRSLTEVSTNVTANLHDVQALQVPLLSPLAAFILPGQASRAFKQGELRGQLTRGVFRITTLTLKSELAQLVILGTITIAGRLDLDVTAQTSNLGFNPVLLRLLARALPPVGPVPISLILRVSDLLADRIIHLRVTGTVRMPVVRIAPIRLLSEQAVRFFLTQALTPSGG